ncbi:MAG TPA: thioredoxin domain-containing protein, partial [Isosphaeraceae bacterium]|nr:thioredoxin domain-containing protein [Isosphaeraceae bacterium]
GPDRAKTFAYVYDVTEGGNWEHKNILNLPKPIATSAKLLGKDEATLQAELDEDRARLLAVRDRRVPPGKDTKILTSWNGLMIAPLAEGARVLRDERYLDAARRAAAFVLEMLRGPDGRLLHSCKDGQARFNAYLDDYANMIDGLTRLYETTGEPRWLDAALDLVRLLRDEFADLDHGGFFYTGKSHEELIARRRDSFDNATPSGNAMAATALLRLGALTGRDDLTETGRATLRSVQFVLEQAPRAAGQSLIALDFLLAPPREFAVIAGTDRDEFRRVIEAVYARFLPHKVVAPATVEQAAELVPRLPLLADRPARDGRTTTYICERFACQAPVLGVEGIEAAIGGRADA